MRWFGESWQAPINEDCDERAVPVGEYCLSCEQTIEEGDRGVELPAMESIAPEGYVVYHLDCWMEEILGPSWRKLLT